MQLAQIKKLAINVMIGSLIGSAAIAVIAVLIGTFSDALWRALFTLLTVTVHAIVCLGFIENKTKSNKGEELTVFNNTIFILVVLSFLTAVFGIWELLPGELIGKLYGTYFVIAFATLHGEMLHKTTGLDKGIDKLVYSNYILMGLVVALLLPSIWVGLDEDIFPGFYYRLLAASAIVDATLTILAVIQHKLYLQKHPEAKSQLFTPVYVTDANGNKVLQNAEAPRRKVHPLLALLGIYLLIQIIGPIIFMIWLGIR